MSQPNWKRPLALAVFLVVLASVTYWLEFNHRPKEEEAAEQSKKITQLKDQQIKSIAISNGNLKDIVFDCKDLAAALCKPGNNPKWELADPLNVKADDTNVNSFVSTLNSLAASDTISLKDETPEKKAALLKEYGLDPATISAHKDREVLITTDAGSTGIYLGVQHPIGEGIFAALEHSAKDQKLTGKIDENTVYILPNLMKPIFERDLTFWRNKKLFNISTPEVAIFHLKTSKTDISGVKTGGAWTLTVHGETFPGDMEAIDNLLTGATYLVAKSFVTDQKTDAKAKQTLKGAKNLLTFSIQKAAPPAPAPSSSGAQTTAAATQSEEPVVLSLFQKQDGKAEKNGAIHMKTYVTLSNTDPLYEVESYAKERLEKDVKDLRLSKLITPMDRFSAKKLSFEGAQLSKPISLGMKDAKWFDSLDPNDTIDSEKVQSLLDKLSSTRTKDFIPMANAKAAVLKAESNSLKMTLGDDTQAEKKRLEFWKVIDKSGSELYARDLASPRKELFLIDFALSEALPWDKNTFTKTKIK
jgi:hypothetical protein